MSVSDDAKKHFSQGYSCSQAVLAVYAESLGLDIDTAFKISGGFGGGIGCAGKTCGALSGAIMVLGLKYGSAKNDPAAKMRIYELSKRALDKFQARNDSTDCEELIGADIRTLQNRASASKKGCFEICPSLVVSAVEVIEEIFTEEQ